MPAVCDFPTTRSRVSAVSPYKISQGDRTMFRRLLFAAVCAGGLVGLSTDSADAGAYDRMWGRSYNTQQWERFYHYPYTYYPQNYWSADYYKSSESLYYRYPQEMRIPVYNKSWQNEYPQARRYHQGHHFILDIF
jgi:hypothetical protein